MVRPALAFVLAAVFSVVAPATHASQSCGRMDVAGAPVVVKVTKGKVSCSTARRILRTYIHSDADCAGEACVRRHEGWRCRLHFEADFPLLASCARARARIGAYSTAKKLPT